MSGGQFAAGTGNILALDYDWTYDITPKPQEDSSPSAAAGGENAGNWKSGAIGKDNNDEIIVLRNAEGSGRHTGRQLGQDDFDTRERPATLSKVLIAPHSILRLDGPGSPRFSNLSLSSGPWFRNGQFNFDDRRSTPSASLGLKPIRAFALCHDVTFSNSSLSWSSPCALCGPFV